MLRSEVAGNGRGYAPPYDLKMLVRLQRSGDGFEGQRNNVRRNLGRKAGAWSQVKAGRAEVVEMGVVKGCWSPRSMRHSSIHTPSLLLLCFASATTPGARPRISRILAFLRWLRRSSSH